MPPLPATGPLSIEVWKTLPAEDKYHEDTLARLRQHDPKLKSAAAWKKFVAEVVRPEIHRDLPKRKKEDG